MIKDWTCLVLGAGNVGEACAAKMVKEGVKRIVLHTLTEEEAYIALQNVKELINGNEVELIPSWGNAFTTKELMFISESELKSSNELMESVLQFFYSPLNDELIKNSSFYYLIEKWKPQIIVDSVNTATVIGYHDDPYSLPRRILLNGFDNKRSCVELLSSAIIPCIIRFTQALHKAILDFKIESYVKVSTTGLGGMGVNLHFTHGDMNEPGMSSGILGKVATSGVIHQLFWSLAHTPNVNLKVVVPAALVGWQKIQFGKFRSNGDNLPLVDNLELIKLEIGEKFTNNQKPITCTNFEIPFVDSGENCAYSLAEMTAITALGEMECITREEVAQAVFESLKGSTKYDLITMMDKAALSSTFAGAIQRRYILDKLAKVEKEKKIASIATNNLGPTVSKHLFELHTIINAMDNSLENVIDTPAQEVGQKVQEIMLNGSDVRLQILSLGLPIVFDDDQVLTGNHVVIPKIDDDHTINKENLKIWADKGWVDFRKPRIEYWQGCIRQLKTEVNEFSKSGNVALERNWQNIDDANVGEVLGYIYSMTGGNKRKEY